MSVNLLAISVGNTRTAWGVFREDQLQATDSATHQDTRALADRLGQAFAPLAEADGATVLMASVNPPVSEQLEAALIDRLGRRVFAVERDVAIPIGRQLDPDARTGTDRLLAAAAAYDVMRQACVVVDAGTAVTVDFVDGAGTFHGGAIGPGARMMLASLHNGAAQLPEADFAAPDETIGHNTVQAMRAAAFHGIRGMVRELTEKYAEIAGAFPVVVATGGDAETLFGSYELVDRVVPDLILRGLALTARAAIGERDAR